jgi:conjugative transfer pilus assembly protein TraH
MIALVIAVALFGGAARADLNGAMNGMLGTMSQTTPAGVYNSATRGTLYGGSINIRSQISNQNLLSFQPPSINAGCGGIDMFGGSFNFINADQFVQLLRNIASNAAGYSFYLALDGICPSCKQTIESIQRKIQELNSLAHNSCQAAKLIMDSTGATNGIKAMSSDVGTMLSDTGVTSGIDGLIGMVPDPLSALQGSAQGKQMLQQQVTGNLVWKAMYNQNSAQWFSTGGDDNLLQAIISLTGSIIVVPQTSNDNTTKNLVTTTVDHTIEFSDLVNGNQGMTLQQCQAGPNGEAATGDPNGCVVMKQIPNQNVMSFEVLVLQQLLGPDTGTGTGYGDGSTGGILYQLSNNITLSQAQQAFMATATTLPAGAVVFNAFHTIGGGAAIAVAQQAGKLLAVEMAWRMVKDFVSVAKYAVGNDIDSNKGSQASALETRYNKLYQQYSAEAARVGNIKDLLEYKRTLAFLSVRDQGNIAIRNIDAMRH